MSLLGIKVLLTCQGEMRLWGKMIWMGPQWMGKPWSMLETGGTFCMLLGHSAHLSSFFGWLVGFLVFFCYFLVFLFVCLFVYLFFEREGFIISTSCP